jgi:pantoate kinase
MRGVAFCPAHITGFFKAELEQQNNFHKGSLGAGFSISKGVTTRVFLSKKTTNDQYYYELKIHGFQPDNTQVSECVIEKFLKMVNYEYFLEVHHNISIPVGYGLGCSGAVALSLSLALNKALGTKLTKVQVGQIAHQAEIECRTGLGDVLASFYGGLEIRTKVGAPGIGVVQKIDTDSTNVLMICFSPISTKKFLSEKLSAINGLGGQMVKKLIKSKHTDDFQNLSLEFAKYIKVITPKMESVIKELSCNNIKCGVALFGETIFTLVHSTQEQKVKKILEKFSDGIMICSQIDNVGARLTN